MRNKGECGECKYYKVGEAYCSLMDDLVEPLDCCGLFDDREGKE